MDPQESRDTIHDDCAGAKIKIARRLLILTALPALRNDEGHWLLPTKFVTGVKEYAQRWSSPVAVGIEEGTLPSANLDNQY